MVKDTCPLEALRSTLYWCWGGGVSDGDWEVIPDMCLKE